MKKLIFIGLSIILINGCSTLSNTTDKAEDEVVKKSLNSIEITSESGKSQPELSAGESIMLVAEGLDEDGNEVDVSPKWSADDGSITPKKGEKVTFTLSEDASGVMTFVTAKQDNVEGEITIEIK